MDDDLKKEALRLIKLIDKAEVEITKQIRWGNDPGELIKNIERATELLKIIMKD